VKKPYSTRDGGIGRGKSFASDDRTKGKEIEGASANGAGSSRWKGGEKDYGIPYRRNEKGGESFSGL